LALLQAFNAISKHLTLDQNMFNDHHPRIAVNTIFFINGFMHANLAARLPRLQEIFSLDNGTLGLLLLSTSVGAVMAMPFTGWLIIRSGSRRMAIVSVFSYCLFFPLISLMPGLVGLIPLFFILGVTAGMLDVSMNSQAVMVEKKKGKPIMTSFHALFSIGMALGALCGSFFSGLNTTFFAHMATITTACLMASVFARYHLIHDKPTGEAEGPAFRLPNAAMISIGVIAFCCMLGEGAMADWSTNYMVNIVRANDTMAPLGLSAFAIAMTIGRILGDGGRLRFGDKSLMVACGLISTAGLAVTLSTNNPFIAMAGFFLVGLGLSVIVPIAYSVAGNSTSVSPGVGLAMVTTVGYSGFLFGPPIIGFVADWQTLKAALVLVAALFILMTWLSWRYEEGKG
jgi:MFS family permease